jgi:hypothetical protein
MQHNPSKTRYIFLGRKNEACPHGGTRGNSNGAEDGPTPGPLRGADFLGQLGRHTGDRRTANYEAADHQHDRQEMGQNERPNKHKLHDRVVGPKCAIRESPCPNRYIWTAEPSGRKYPAKCLLFRQLSRILAPEAYSPSPSPSPTPISADQGLESGMLLLDRTPEIVKE